MISVIIPTKNRVKNLIKVFDSLNTNTYFYQDVEVVLYVDGDDDPTTINEAPLSCTSILLTAFLSSINESQTGLQDLIVGMSLVFIKNPASSAVEVTHIVGDGSSDSAHINKHIMV